MFICLYFRRTLGAYKKTVRNKARPEGSIAEAYTLKECVIFCKKYLGGVETRLLHKERHKDKEHQQDAELSIFSHKIQAIGAASYVNLSLEDHEMATWYILNNCDEIRQYIE
ncbi:MAG: DUF4218 domain-containing protein [Gammaproteobacteria bacterium]|nr:DUF4218 domain-containing protein [Gammaproteobacteria bacterium]